MEVLINNRQKKIRLDTRRIRLISEEIMAFEGLAANAELSVVFCDDDFIQKLNDQYLGKNQPTDVLSFPQEEDDFENGIRLLGDVVISVETACRQAEKMRHSIDLEIVFLLTHGILHLCGYDHLRKADLTKMKNREELICRWLEEKKLLKEIAGASPASLIKRAQDPESDKTSASPVKKASASRSKRPKPS